MSTGINHPIADIALRQLQGAFIRQDGLESNFRQAQREVMAGRALIVAWQLILQTTGMTTPYTPNEVEQALETLLTARSANAEQPPSPQPFEERQPKEPGKDLYPEE